MFNWFQYLLPQRLISKTAHSLADSQSLMIKSLMIRGFMKYYQVNPSDFEPKPSQYRSFNDFFTRPLRAGARSIHGGQNSMVAPVDGTIIQWGSLSEGYLIRAKNEKLSASQLLGGETQAEIFKKGSFIAFYLAPQDYHRVHMPVAGSLEQMRGISGSLFSVNPSLRIPRIFTRNERVTTIFDTGWGKMALVMIGAMVVGSIETTWAGEVMAAGKARIASRSYSHVLLNRGQEMGRFKFGSSVVLLFQQSLQWGSHVREGSRVKMGQLLGTFERPLPHRVKAMASNGVELPISGNEKNLQRRKK